MISISEFSFSFKCGHDKIKKIPKIINNSIVKNNSTRCLDDTYHPISFFIDYTQMEKDSIGDSTYINFLKSAIDSTLETFRNLIKVKRTEKLLFSSPDCYEKIKYYDNQITTTGVDYDIILIPIIDPSLGEGVDAAASACYLNNDNRPIMGFVLLNEKYSYTKNNAKDYLTMLLLHEISHVLVFSDSLFNLFNYKGNVTTTKIINGIERKLITTSKVKSIASQHFNCSSIVGVELENQGGNGSEGSHWEARVMLGDYMISTDYPEIVISDITLALFEDSGWYEVNYYTGGLFRYGKGQGCKFLNSSCVTSSESNFEWDFCDTPNEKKCSSNNLNRGFCYLKKYDSELESHYQYFDDKNIGGWESVDYCPITLDYSSNQYYFKSSCIYGELSDEEKNYPSSLGFKISENSICIQSSLVKSSDIELKKYAEKRAMCHEILCDNDTKSITVDIGDFTIDCPTDGGEMEVDGYDGTILCPPYNRVCTSEEYFADPIKAVLNKISNSDIDYSFILNENNENNETNETNENNGNDSYTIRDSSHKFLEIGLYRYILLLFLYFKN